VGIWKWEGGPVVVPNQRDYAAARMREWEYGSGKAECGSENYMRQKIHAQLPAQRPAARRENQVFNVIIRIYHYQT